MDNEKNKFDATKYKNDFQKEKYDRIIVNVPKGQKHVIDEQAKKRGYKSLNSFVVDAINEKLEKWTNEFKAVEIWLYFFVFINLVQDAQKESEILVQDYIFTSCTRMLIILLQGQTKQTNTTLKTKNGGNTYEYNYTLRLHGISA